MRKNGPKKVPLGRTLSTYDHFLGRSKTGSMKQRTAVVIERNARDELAVVPLSSRAGSHRTRMKKYQQGKSYFKHFVEIEDNEGNPIKVNAKFRENHKNQDVSEKDVNAIRNKVLFRSTPSQRNNDVMKRFRKGK